MRLKANLDSPAGHSWNDWMRLMQARAKRCATPVMPSVVTSIFEMELREFIEGYLFSGTMSPMQQFEYYRGKEDSSGRRRGGMRSGPYGRGSSGKARHIINPWEKWRQQGLDVKRKISDKRRKAGKKPLEEGPGFIESLAFHYSSGSAQWLSIVSTEAKMTPYAVDLPTKGTPYYLRHGWAGVNEDGRPVRMEPRWPEGACKYLDERKNSTYVRLVTLMNMYIINGLRKGGP